MAALLTFNDPDLTCPGGGCSGTQIWQATNDISGAACGTASPAFCPTLQPLFALPPQPSFCQPVGPPLASRVDVSGANAGDVNVGAPNVDPSTLNRLMAADQNSNCVASVNLDDLSVDWFYANGPTNQVFAMPYVPQSCLPGGDLFAATLAGEQCERQGPPPVGGYQNCGGVSFLSVGGGGLLPELAAVPLHAPRRPMPPVRIFDYVERVSFVGPDVLVSNSETQLLTPVPFQMLAIVGTGSGDMVYVDIGIGRPDAAQLARIDAGQFALPGGLLGPTAGGHQRLHHRTRFPPRSPASRPAPSMGARDPGAVTAQLVAPRGLSQPMADPPPSTDRLGASFVTPLGSDGLALDTLSCYSIPIGSQVCVTGGLVQKGTAQTEFFVATYQGSLPNLAEISANLNGSSLQISSAGDLTQINGGLLISEGADGGNLTRSAVGHQAAAVGDHGIFGGVTPTSLTLLSAITDLWSSSGSSRPRSSLRTRSLSRCRAPRPAS